MSGIIDTVGARSGIVGSDVYPAGHIVQTSLHATDNTKTTCSTTNNTWSPTVVSASITPKYNDSSIIINCHFACFIESTTNAGLVMKWGRQTGGSTTYPASIGIGANDSSNGYFYFYVNHGGLIPYLGNYSFTHCLIDSPATTSAITYQLEVAGYSVVTLNCGAVNTSAAWHLFFQEIKR